MRANMFLRLMGCTASELSSESESLCYGWLIGEQ
jgi:hypothetical protein